MVDYTQKYKEIVKSLVNKSFPVLKGKKVIIKEANLKKFHGMAWDFWLVKIILLDKRLRKISNIKIKGLLAHELCHFEIYAKLSFIDKLIFCLKVVFSKEFKRENERTTDLLTIKKGYGKELFESKKLQSEKRRYFYLTQQEIKKYLKKYRK